MDYIILTIYDNNNKDNKCYDFCSKNNQRNYQHQFKKSLVSETKSRNPLIQHFRDTNVAPQDIRFEVITQQDCSKAEIIKTLDAFAKEHNVITSRTSKLQVVNKIADFLTQSDNSSTEAETETDDDERTILVKAIADALINYDKALTELDNYDNPKPVIEAKEKKKPRAKKTKSIEAEKVIEPVIEPSVEATDDTDSDLDFDKDDMKALKEVLKNMNRKKLIKY